MGTRTSTQGTSRTGPSRTSPRPTTRFRRRRPSYARGPVDRSEELDGGAEGNGRAGRGAPPQPDQGEAGARPVQHEQPARPGNVHDDAVDELPGGRDERYRRCEARRELLRLTIVLLKRSHNCSGQFGSVVASAANM